MTCLEDKNVDNKFVMKDLNEFNNRTKDFILNTIWQINCF